MSKFTLDQSGTYGIYSGGSVGPQGLVSNEAPGHWQAYEQGRTGFANELVAEVKVFDFHRALKCQRNIRLEYDTKVKRSPLSLIRVAGGAIIGVLCCGCLSNFYIYLSVVVMLELCV